MVGVTGAVRAGEPLTRDEFAEFRARMVFEHGKWDPQSGDRAALAPFSLHLSREEWAGISRAAELLWSEALCAERELLDRTELHRRLALPRRLRFAMRRAAGGAEAPTVRFARFDFHPTVDGWRISEMNSDVPGGFLEAAALTALALERESGVVTAGDPAGALARAIASLDLDGGAVALVHATAYSDDRQSMASLGARLAALGVSSALAAPDHLEWSGGRASFRGPEATGDRVGAVVRFYPAEWLVELPRRSGWENYIRSGATGLSNPATAMLTQSKRFPLVWDELSTSLPTWRALLPRTIDPRDARSLEGLVLKPALGRVGEGVRVPGALRPDAKKAAKWASRRPERWIAQERFESAAVATCEGEVHACVGVFVVDGKTAGAYGRVAAGARIDQTAQDAAVLVDAPAPALMNGASAGCR